MVYFVVGRLGQVQHEGEEIMSIDVQKRRNRERSVYVLAVILMIIRVDFWWWGEEMPLVVFGWINVPMLYQFGIWVAGFALVLYTVKYIWVDEQ